MAKSVTSLRSPLQVVGQSVTRTDARVKVTGEAQFSADRMPADGLLYGKTLRSPHSHAEIVHIDAARADGLPEVRAVVTFRDVPENPFEDGDVVAPDGPLAPVYLLNRIVRHVGDEGCCRGRLRRSPKRRCVSLKLSIAPSCRERLRTIMVTSDGIGWGYHDGLCEQYYEGFPEDE
jgi:Aldehyde oxidase and xanthine dehydrogenase, a/b hammerhead domain